jgi:hypothetical protein
VNADIELGTIQADPMPSSLDRRPLVMTVVALAVALVLTAGAAFAAATRMPGPASAVPPTPISKHQVVLTATGFVTYYVISGPDGRSRGSQMPVKAVVASGTLLVVIGAAPDDGGESKCSITIDGVEALAVDGLGVVAVSECDYVVK